MKIVLDSNIIFSALLSSKNKFQYLLYSKEFKFFSCNFLFVEIFKNKEKLQKTSKLSEEDLMIQLSNILSKIQFIPEVLIPRDIFVKAYNLCKDVDESDTPFLALAMFLKAKLLTGDKKLTKYLRKKGLDLVITINEILD
jgi:predicted nucleic acid-binding protein